jgi:hypothetical protein
VGAHFADDTFHIFHPDVGYTVFHFELESIEQIDSELERIFSILF